MNFCLIGYPLGHSMSPFIHRELFCINGISSDYTLNTIEPERLSESFEKLKALKGFNVTIPHKTSIIPLLSDLSERARLFGAVNTVKLNENGAKGYNTDCFGFLRALEMAGITLGGRVLLCGSGGVSRMFAFESILAGAELTIAVRDADIEAAELIKKEIEDKLGKTANVITLDKVDGAYDLLINGTPVGMHPNVDACVLPEEKVKKCGAVFDAVYNPLETKLVRYAKEAGIKCSNGLSMLVWQAAVAQEIWLGVEFSMDDIRKVLKKTEEEMKK